MGSEKRKRVLLTMRPEVHEKLRQMAETQYLSMSRIVELMIEDSTPYYKAGAEILKLLEIARSCGAIKHNEGDE